MSFAFNQWAITTTALTQTTMQYVTDAKGERPAVMLSLEEYERMVEDLADLAAAAERRDEVPIAHDQIVEELKRDGLLPR